MPAVRAARTGIPGLTPTALVTRYEDTAGERAWPILVSRLVSMIADLLRAAEELAPEQLEWWEEQWRQRAWDEDLIAT
jgi:hypothetical protein